MDSKLPLILAAVASVCFSLLVVSFVMVVCRRRLSVEDQARRTGNVHDPSSPPGYRSVTTLDESTSFDPSISEISMAELSVVTQGFSSDLIVGDGSFGLVYRAELSNGVVVAVKKLDTDSFQGLREFTAEMETLGKLRHPNIVRILGYCISGPDRVLIYEFLEKGSLDYWLHESTHSPLSWSTRITIAQGVAKGLAYLHGRPKRIIHRDIKSSNVLLDSEFEAHLADFGLARMMDSSRSHVSTQVAGTMGYMPPEYREGNTAATSMADVYSFGILMVEMATEKRPNWPVKVEGKEIGLAEWAVLMEGQNRYDEIVECEMKSEESVKEYIRIACLCIKEASRERPTMKEVVKLLQALCSLN